MKDESHREHSIQTFNKYLNDTLKVQTHKLSALGDDELLKEPYENKCIYVLRLDLEKRGNENIRYIVNQRDKKAILYIGGHPSGKRTSRFNKLIKACRKAERFFDRNGYSENDVTHEHSVANYFTTSLLQANFRLSNCIIDLVKCESDFDELEFIIGYQEHYHHLPPWNALRGGASAFKTQVEK